MTDAALLLTLNLDTSKKRYYMAKSAEHYGIFNSSKWRGKIAGGGRIRRPCMVRG